MVQVFSKIGGNAGNPDNFKNYALYEVTEECPSPLSFNTAQCSAQHMQKAHNTVA
jgi:hypothetical protein